MAAHRWTLIRFILYGPEDLSFSIILIFKMSCLSVLLQKLVTFKVDNFVEQWLALSLSIGQQALSVTESSAFHAMLAGVTLRNLF